MARLDKNPGQIHQKIVLPKSCRYSLARCMVLPNPGKVHVRLSYNVRWSYKVLLLLACKTLARLDKNPGKDHVRWSYQILPLLACKTLARHEKNPDKIHPKMVSPNLATTGLQELAKI